MADNTIFPSIRPGARAATVATSEGLDRAMIESRFERGECPWCDDGSFERPKMHARQVHPEKWEDYNDRED